MKEQEFEDNFIESIVKNKDRKILSEKFDTQIMESIRLKHTQKQDISSQLKTSMRYFLIAIVLLVGYPLFMIITKAFKTEFTTIVSIGILFFSLAIGIIFILNYRNQIEKPLLDI